MAHKIAYAAPAIAHAPPMAHKIAYAAPAIAAPLMARKIAYAAPAIAAPLMTRKIAYAAPASGSLRLAGIRSWVRRSQLHARLRVQRWSGWCHQVHHCRQQADR